MGDDGLHALPFGHLCQLPVMRIPKGLYQIEIICGGIHQDQAFYVFWVVVCHKERHNVT